MCLFKDLRNFMTKRSTIVSTPGKVLLTGGYLVLEGKPGLVLSLDSRFTIEVSDADTTDHRIDIYSPQFSNGRWSLSESGQLLYFNHFN
jgi:phosphomevalonate kinase